MNTLYSIWQMYTFISLLCFIDNNALKNNLCFYFSVFSILFDLEINVLNR